MNYQQNNGYPSGSYRPAPRKKKKKISWNTICIIIAAILLITGVKSYFSDKSIPKDHEGIAATVEDYIIPIENCYHYTQLDDYGKFVYRHILEQLPSGTNKIIIEGISRDTYNEIFTRDRISDVIDAICNDHPEIFWVDDGWRGISYTGASDSVSIEMNQYDFWEYSSNKQKMAETFFTELDKITATAKEYGTDYDRIKFVHDYIINNTEYDHNAANAITSNNWIARDQSDQSAYGSIVKGTCVCAGYSRTFQVITQQLGYECIYISGETAEGLHAWNMINLDGDYYYFDVTWDDVDEKTDENGNVIQSAKIEYEYFAAASDEFSREHTDCDFNYPYCSATEYNFHHRNGYVIDRYSEKQIKAVIEKQLAKRQPELYLKFYDSGTMTKALDYLKKNIADIVGKYGYYEYFYWYNDETMFTVTFYLPYEYQ